MLVLLLLAVSVRLGVSYYEEEWYGNTHRMRLHKRAHSITFIPKSSSNEMILWKRDDPPASEDSRRKIMGAHFVINKLTQRDSGRYIVSDIDKKMLFTTTIAVIANTLSFTLSPGQQFNFTFHSLEPNSCNIYFFPENDHDLGTTKIELVRHGRLQLHFDEFDCAEFELLKPCGILIKDVQMSCSGHFEVKDQDDNKALVVSLHMESVHKDPYHLVVAVGGVFAALFCYCCAKSCCCGKSSSKEESSETTAVAAEPAVRYHEHDHRPVSPRRAHLSQPSGTHYPARPSTSPLIHHAPTANVPPAYSEVSAPAEQADAPTVPLCSDPEPRFELKGMTFASASPLSSNSVYCDVYTSDKINSL
ncbi:uncharacterized protein [Trachinotus anak]|uniref:uncharacterized protein n=1 Tax=Trachinotus anak TaxID=443729 RepID=UPI0039F246AA